ncbi:hypothetical protein T484DRAFT_1896343, partial [Baffinella frigidus]
MLAADEFDPSALGEPERATKIWFDADTHQFKREERMVRVGTSVAVDGRRRGLVLMVDQGEREGLMYIVKRFKTDHEQDEELMDETKIGALALWYGEKYHSMAQRPPGAFTPRFLPVWTYNLMERSGSPMVSVEPLIPDYEDVDLGGPVATSEQQVATAFALFTYHASSGKILIHSPTRACPGWWTKPRIASVDCVGGLIDDGKQGMWDFFTSNPSANAASLSAPEGSQQVRNIGRDVPESVTGPPAEDPFDALVQQQAAWRFQKRLITTFSGPPPAVSGSGVRFGHFSASAIGAARRHVTSGGGPVPPVSVLLQAARASRPAFTHPGVVEQPQSEAEQRQAETVKNFRKHMSGEMRLEMDAQRALEKSEADAEDERAQEELQAELAAEAASTAAEAARTLATMQAIPVPPARLAMLLPEEQTFHIHSELHDETLNNLMAIRDHGGSWLDYRSYLEKVISGLRSEVDPSSMYTPRKPPQPRQNGDEHDHGQELRSRGGSDAGASGGRGG